MRLDRASGQLLRLPLKPQLDFEIPVASYTFDHGRLGWDIIPPLLDRASPLRTTHLRDPYGPPILFGSESFMDEIAAATDTDPVDFRLRHLKDPRGRAVIAEVLRLSRWNSFRNGEGKGRGGELVRDAVAGRVGRSDGQHQGRQKRA